MLHTYRGWKEGRGGRHIYPFMLRLIDRGCRQTLRTHTVHNVSCMMSEVAANPSNKWVSHQFANNGSRKPYVYVYPLRPCSTENAVLVVGIDPRKRDLQQQCISFVGDVCIQGGGEGVEASFICTGFCDSHDTFSNQLVRTGRRCHIHVLLYVQRSTRSHCSIILLHGEPCNTAAVCAAYYYCLCCLRTTQEHPTGRYARVLPSVRCTTNRNMRLLAVGV